MATPFLKSVAQFIFDQHKDTPQTLCVVLPNKRGALFLKNYLAETYGKTIWLPAIISAEDLVNELSGLKVLEEIDLICHLYDSYRICYGAQAENFESFAKWGQLMLQDFNEIDRYLVDAEQLYENLKDIKEIENWSLGEENLSEFQINYLRFMNSLGSIYSHYSSTLLSKGWSYQGLAYRQAVHADQEHNFIRQYDHFLFCGFNALNAAELRIIRKLKDQNKATLLWDADAYYLDDVNQEAGLFLRQNKSYFNLPELTFTGRYFDQPKSIRVVSVPKQIGQAQVVKQSLQHLLQEGVPADKIAVVLANEKLLWPVLQQLPPEIEHVNITMEYPLRYTSTYSLVESLLQIQVSFAKQNRAQKTIYHKELIALLRQPVFQQYLEATGCELAINQIIQQINVKNLSFLSGNHLQSLLGEAYATLGPLLSPSRDSHTLCALLLLVLQSTRDYFLTKTLNSRQQLELEYLQTILVHFNRLSDLLHTYPHFNDLPAFRQLYQQVVGTATAPFIGEPLRGLQIMGVLETRTLDFDHVVLVNVNEGVLPSGKSVNSFIPNDLKRAFGMPLYVEKDAIYAYHFYRLLQRAADVTITYDSETDSFGKGEKSRFVTQLLLELKRYQPSTNITEEIASDEAFPEKPSNELHIQKNSNTLQPIQTKAFGNGTYESLSPSSLITFKSCSLKFYLRYGARLKELEEVEESAEANTFGSILHLSLEDLYKPFIGKEIQESDIRHQLQEVPMAVRRSFTSLFEESALSGKNLLQEEVIKVYVSKLLKSDGKFIAQLHNKQDHLKILGLEQEYTASLQIQTTNGPKTVYVKGKMDRIDQFGGHTRVIDYKSSVKSTDQFTFVGFEPLFHKPEYDKQLQLMLYAWMLSQNKVCKAEDLLPCIVPFKVFKEQPYYLLNEDKQTLRFTETLLMEFEQALKEFIEDIFDATKDFVQTNDLDICKYCAYKGICERAD
jgi:ATP-dependent helicase/nuclease subunit B